MEISKEKNISKNYLQTKKYIHIKHKINGFIYYTLYIYKS